jgi:hypothetical protein
MKTKKIIFLFATICAIMLINISVTNNGAIRLKAKVGSLKEAQADYPVENNSYTTWTLSPNGVPARNDWFGQLSCEYKYGYFSNPCYCSKASE